MLEQAMAAEDWAGALPLALAAWRADRRAEHADLIDRITSRCTLPKPPHTRASIHRWWMASAVDPDPIMIGALLGTLSQRMYISDVPWETMRARWPGNPIIEAVDAMPPLRWRVSWAERNGEPFVWNRSVPNWVDRAAAMYTWPDDPRVARAFAGLIADSYTWIEGEGVGPWQVIADKLRALGDRRIGHVFAKTATYHNNTPRQMKLIELRSEFAVEESREPALPEVHVELEALWKEVGEHRDDDGPRLVLADALLARGDNRGELIVLQCAPDPAKLGHAKMQAQRLIKLEWDRWMGDLALLLANRGTEMQRGMLHAVRIGLSNTPGWAWDAVRGHHELVTVQEVRPALALPEAYVRFIHGLPHFPRFVEFDAPEAIQELLASGADRPLVHARYQTTSSMLHYRRAMPSFAETVGMLARLAPRLEILELGYGWWTGGSPTRELPRSQFIDWIEHVQSLFPALSKIRVASSTVAFDAQPVMARFPILELTPAR